MIAFICLLDFFTYLRIEDDICNRLTRKNFRDNRLYVAVDVILFGVLGVNKE